MDALFDQVLAWVSGHPGWAYAAIFAVAMGESTAIIGLIVPGVVLLLGTGALITTGAIAFWPAFAAAVIGAVVGDGLSYGLGRHYKLRLRGIWPFCRYPESLDQGIAFFARHGTWSVVIGRFAGPSRAFTPLVAGMLDMSPRRFFTADIASAMAQILTYFIPGMVLGASLKLAAEAAVRLAILGLLLAGTLWFIFWAAHRVYRLLAPHAGHWLQRLLRWADLHPGLGGLALALADPTHPDARALTGLAFLLLLGTLLLGAVTGLTLFGPRELALNLAALDLGQSLHTPLGNRLMIALAAFGAPIVVLPMVLLVYAWLRWRGDEHRGHYWLATAAFPLAATLVLGALLAVPRPDLGLHLALPWSFPSGPVVLATSVYGFLAIAIARGLAAPLRWVPYALATTLITAVAGARVYLGAEWLTSVINSIALGLVWVAALGLAFRRHSRLALRPGALAAVAAIGLAAGLSLHDAVTGDRDRERLTPAPRIATLEHRAWQGAAWARLPRHREDLSQRHRHPLTIQYAGDPALLTEALAGSGWQPAPLLDWGSALRLLSPSLPLAEIPVIPQVHDGRHEALILARPTGADHREVLRLWPTRWRLTDGAPLWVGNVTRQHRGLLLNLIVVPTTDTHDFRLPAEFERELPGLRLRAASGDGPLRIEEEPARAPPEP
ncbi:bifunctional DedA family/phosphatase PAP2 family protein [Candidatus Thiodictyon syntrophicum]|uniref:Membrane-associated protein n=1 Tax=Candidatus Thiodictyon syntrophicum TaxID=1166950 RepID=A0A2K8U3L0_9GAMM|nr:bifunctional DedA family/phosphatase PAP2 family protein [Candidatus Thiodictyon syntrophicum]AUB80172.1 membrane-associated protein [Candidatus Thiodictyon syntrophicum]